MSKWMGFPDFTHRTPCMDNPPRFDSEMPGEDADRANRRMSESARICRDSCPEFQTCRAFYASAPRPGGVVAGEFKPRRRVGGSVLGGKYVDGDPCSVCGTPMLVDVRSEDPIPEGWVQRKSGTRCRPCVRKREIETRQMRKLAGAAS